MPKSQIQPFPAPAKSRLREFEAMGKIDRSNYLRTCLLYNLPGMMKLN